MVLEMPTRSKRRQALEILPTDLYDTFQGIITRIQECGRAGQAELGMRVLMWLHFAHRPLMLNELQHALAVEKSHTEFDADNIPPKKALLDSCLGLVVVDEETSTVRFVHYTLQEYFRNNSWAEFPNGYTYIAETCLTYLNFGQLKQHCTSNTSLKEKLNQYTFLKYAARYWGTYIQEHQQCNDLMELTKMILDHERECPPCAIQALSFELYPYGQSVKKWSGIHVVAFFGLSEIMAYLCKVGQYKELRDDKGRTPLSWAAENGHEAVVQLLVERDDVDINAMSGSGQTPLTLAAGNGHEAVVRLLVERDDIDINTKDNVGWTSLLWAAARGDEAVVRLLVETGNVDINTKDNNGQTPLSWAAAMGHEAVVRLLVETGNVDIDTKDNDGWTPLTWAAAGGHEAVVRLLVEADNVDINTKDNNGRAPLFWATKGGHEAIVQLLKDHHGMEVGAPDTAPADSFVGGAVGAVVSVQSQPSGSAD